jgi:YVTN family beta-propeller protein
MITSILAIPSSFAYVGSVQVGVHPYGIVYNGISDKIYVANFDSDSVSVIDPASNQVVATIPVESNPRQMAINTINGNVYVMNSGSDSVSVIDPASNQVVATIPVGDQPSGGAYNPQNNQLLVANNNFSNGDNTLTVVDTDTNEVIDNENAGSLPWGMAFNPITGDIYVTNQNTMSVTIIDGETNEPKGTIPVGSDPIGISVNPNSQKIYVTNHEGPNAGTISVINASTSEVIRTISLGNHTQPIAIAFNPNNNTVYVTDQVERAVFVIDGVTDNVIGNLTTGTGPAGATFNPQTETLYVTNYYSNTVRTYSDDSINTTQPSSNNLNLNFYSQTNNFFNQSKYKVSDSSTILLNDKSLPSESYIHLYDSSPFKIQKGHIAAKLPCEDDNSTSVQLYAGEVPNFSLLQTQFIPQLSESGSICMYHTDIASTKDKPITDIAILNNSTDDIEFPETSTVVININEISNTKTVSTS